MADSACAASMLSGARTRTAIALALASCAALVGCGGATSGNGVASEPAAQIVAAAKQAALGAASVHVAGSIVSEGKPISLNMEFVADKGGQGRVALDGLSFRLVDVDRAVYVSGSDAFYTRFAGAVAARVLRGRWLNAAHIDSTDARGRRAISARRRAEALPADLDALRRFADDARRLRPNHHRCRRQRQGRRNVHVPRHWQRAEVQRLPRSLRRRQGPKGRRRRGVEASLAAGHGRRRAEIQGHPARTAFHRAAAALQRSDAGQGTGSRRRRPPVHVRIDPLHDPGARVRQERRRQIHTHRAGHGGHRPVARKLPESCSM